MITNIVLSVFPSNAAIGMPLSSTIQVVLDIEADEDITKQSIFLVGADTDEVIFTDYEIRSMIRGDDSLFSSPGYKGIVPGKYIFQRLNPITLQEEDITDTTGIGNLYKTRVTFTPNRPLAQDLKYTIFIVGDGGITTRTVFDLQPDGGNVGTILPIASGTYSGNVSTDSITIRIVDSGIVGTATYEAWLNSSPLSLIGPIKTHSNFRLLTKGVTIAFPSGQYVSNDTYSVVLKQPQTFEGILNSMFTTGGGNIQIVSGTTATSPSGEPLYTPVDTNLVVLSTSPEHLSANNPRKQYDQIVIKFNKNIDPSTVNAQNIKVTAFPVVDHPNLQSFSPNGEIGKTVTVVDNKIIIDI